MMRRRVPSGVPLVLAFPLEAEKLFRADAVAIAAGDNLTILREREQIRMRLEGIDAPERRDPFSEAARQRISPSPSPARWSSSLRRPIAMEARRARSSCPAVAGART